MARAITSLPVPDSPSINIGISDDAIWRSRWISVPQLGISVVKPTGPSVADSSSMLGASTSIGSRSKNRNKVWPSSISEPSVSTARFVV